jgi:3-keto-5-aminohexanoate cleavage enzyme
MEKLIIYVCPGSPDYANPKYPAIPKSWDALVEEAIAAREAGASIIHLHGPQNADGRLLPDGWGKVTEDIRKASGLLVDFGRDGSPPEYRIPLMKLGTGSADFMAFSLTNHDYQRDTSARPVRGKEGKYDVYFNHTRAELATYAELALEYRIKPNWEVWLLGALWNFQYLVDRGLAQGRHWFALFFGSSGGSWSPATMSEMGHRLDHMPAGSHSMVVPRGPDGPMNQVRMMTYGILRGAHIRIGSQDVPDYLDGVPAKSNAELIARVVRIAKELGREIATPEEVRALFDLPRK